MKQPLAGRRIAVLATDGFEQSELLEPRRALAAAGALTEVVSPRGGSIRGWNEGNWGQDVAVDAALRRARPEDYDGLLLPGGVMNPDQLRGEPMAVEFVRKFFEAGKPVAAICHGPQLLIEAGVVRDRKLTSFPSLKTDLRNAGAHWVDEAVVVDRGLVTSRQPADIPRFNERMVREFEGGSRARLAGRGPAS
jgi:protease I